MERIRIKKIRRIAKKQKSLKIILIKMKVRMKTQQRLLLRRKLMMGMAG